MSSDGPLNIDIIIDEHCVCVCVCVCVYVGGSWLQSEGEDGCEQGNGAMEVCSTEQVH